MFAGGCVGSTGGAIKIKRLIIVIKAIIRELQKMIHPSRVIRIKLNGESLDEEMVGRFIGFFMIWLFLFAGIGIILVVLGEPLDIAFSGSASCLGNVGPGIGDLAVNYTTVKTASKLLLCFAMLLGRLEVFRVVILFSPLMWRRS
jgi:trk system potassium uptake protein TrkH